ncbi:MAG TPA: chloride channel protein, partial [Acidimicrobiales bacterium]|nr:chloride channel protein [Acidimicrobiales bacterium]
MVRKRNTESERLRDPPPMIKRRVPSGRGAMEQPNVTHDGEARLTPQFWLAVVLVGVATGLFGDLLMWLLAEVERAGFHYHSGYFQNAVEAVSSSRRIVVLMIGSVIGAVSWYLIRRYLQRENSDI